MSDRRQQNRAAMPESTAIVDELRKVFGSLPYGKFEENGRTVEWGERKNLGEPVQASLPVKK